MYQRHLYVIDVPATSMCKDVPATIMCKIPEIDLEDRQDSKMASDLSGFNAILLCANHECNDSRPFSAECHQHIVADRHYHHILQLGSHSHHDHDNGII